VIRVCECVVRTKIIWAYVCLLCQTGALFLEQTDLSGQADPVCLNRPNLQVVADCGGFNPEVVCSCCARCCVDGVTCHDETLLADSDPVWEVGYRRYAYDFLNQLGNFIRY